MAKRKASRDSGKALSAAQLEVMGVVWELEEASVAEVWKALSKSRKIARNTVQTTLVRLEEKGYLTHREVGNAFRYSATKAPQNTVREMLRSLLTHAFKGSTEGLVMALLEESSPSAEELKRIRKTLGQLQKQKEE